MTWDPDRYLRFADLRTRPGLELLARIDHSGPRQVVDLGCGTGQLTAMLARRWPLAAVLGVDSSTEMLSRASTQFSGTEWAALKWENADISEWRPRRAADVIFSNAALQWVGDHESLFPSLLEILEPGGVLAVQMPDNWDQPSHRLIVDLVGDRRWRDRTAPFFSHRPVHPVTEYLHWLEPYTEELDVWRTTYYHYLEGPDPVLSWVKGSVLGPILANLHDDELVEFESVLAAGYARAYPLNESGRTVFPFSRVFIVAQKQK